MLHNSEKTSAQVKSAAMNIESLEKCRNKLMSIELACSQASGGYPPEIVDSNGKSSLDGIQIEVDGCVKMTGRFRAKDRPGQVFKPFGLWPERCGDFTHEEDCHGLDDLPDDINNESILMGELAGLYVENGIEMACGDVSRAILDPKMVHEAWATEMVFFKSMGFYDRAPRAG